MNIAVARFSSKSTLTMILLLALAKFKRNFYDLLLVDVNMSKVNDFEFSEKILELDVNVRVCYIFCGRNEHRSIEGSI
jgi:two-component SAPR family response regulator